MHRASLNHAYRLVWSDVTQAYVAVAENTKSRGKRTTVALAVALLLGTSLVTPGAEAVDLVNFYTAVDAPHTVGNGETFKNDGGPYAAHVDVGNYTSTFTNDGTLNADYSGEAVGLYFNDIVSGTVINNGTITADATPEFIAYETTFGYTTSYYQANATGIRIGGLTNVLSNNGTINVTADSSSSSNARAYGIDINTVSGSLTNGSNGVIQVVATADSSYAAATGIDISGIEGGSLTNNGEISATATGYSANANGVEIEDLIGTMANQGQINATASGYRANATGIEVDWMGEDSSITNSASGLINVRATGLDYDAEAYGILLDSGIYQNSDLTNSGTITVKADGGEDAEAAGIYVYGSVDGELENSAEGEITATATTVDIPGYYGVREFAKAYGISLQDDIAGTGVIKNAGKITAIADGAEGAEASGIHMYGVLNGDLTNAATGVITARAHTKNPSIDSPQLARAYGVYLDNYISESGAIVNAGKIDVSADGAGDADAAGIYVSSGGLGSLQIQTTAVANSEYGITNSGTILVSAVGNENATAAGIFATGVAINNSGTISAIAKTSAGQGNGSAAAVGVIAEGYGGTILNTGTIRADATLTQGESDGDATSFGMVIFGTESPFTNRGTITATASLTDGATGYAEAAGVVIADLNGTLANEGIIHGSYSVSAAADGGEGTSLTIFGGTGTVENRVTGQLIGGINIGSYGGFGVLEISESAGIAVNNHGSLILKNGVDLNNIRNSGTPTTGYIAGNYTQSATGIFHIAAVTAESGSESEYEVAAFSPTPTRLTAGGYSQLEVGGTATIAGTAFVDVKKANTLAIDQTLSSVVTAGTLTGNFASVADNSALFNFVSVINPDDANAIDFNIVKGLTSVQAVTFTGNRAGLGAAGALDAIIDGGNGGAMQGVIDALGSLSTEQEVSDAVSQVLPLMAGGTSRIILNSMRGANRAVQARQEGQQGRSSGDMFYGDKNIWLKPFGSWADQDNRNGTSGYDADTYGMAIGADATISDTTRMGVAFSYAKTDVDSKSAVAQQSSDVNSYQFVLYGSHDLSPATDLNFQADIGMHDSDGRRTIDFGGLSSVARSSYDSWSAHIGAGLAHSMKWTEKTSFTPSVRADYTMVRDDSYRETGADALNLNVKSNRTEEFIVGVDGKLAHALNDKATFTANLGVGYDLINDQASITSAFAGAPTVAFTTKGIDPSPWLARGGLGIVGKLTETMEVSARYDVEVREDFNNQTVSVKARWAF